MTTVAKAFLDIRGTGQRREEEAGETCVAQEMPFVAYAGPVRPAAALRESVLCLPTDIHSLFVNKPSSSSSFTASALNKLSSSSSSSLLLDRRPHASPVFTG